MLIGLQTGVICLLSVIFVSGMAVDCALSDAEKKLSRKATGEKNEIGQIFEGIQNT